MTAHKDLELGLSGVSCFGGVPVERNSARCPPGASGGPHHEPAGGRPPSTGSKVVLWAESRLPRQTWSINELGHMCSQMFEGRILDVKGGRGYDQDHVVLWEPAKDRASQVWTVHVL